MSHNPHVCVAIRACESRSACMRRDVRDMFVTQATASHTACVSRDRAVTQPDDPHQQHSVMNRQCHHLQRPPGHHSPALTSTQHQQQQYGDSSTTVSTIQWQYAVRVPALTSSQQHQPSAATSSTARSPSSSTGIITHQWQHGGRRSGNLFSASISSSFLAPRFLAHYRSAPKFHSAAPAAPAEPGPHRNSTT